MIGRKLQEYVIRERIGTGGMGIVYRAEQTMIGKQVAIKVLRPDVVTDPRDMERLLEEARVVNSIKHRGIINIFSAGTTEDGRNYLIMEFLEGESLEQLMQREGKVPPGDAVLILEEVLSALAAAHEAGIVHRDLKPANIFLVKEGAKVYVKLLDFGLARRDKQQVTRIAGTPDYISPEHAKGRPAGPPADLYAFGVLCFHMLTGRLVFPGNSPIEVMEQHVHTPPPVPHEVNPGIPKALSELILKLLAKEPGQRPDAFQVKADLRIATKQLRTATTMMNLESVDDLAPVKSDPVGPTPPMEEVAPVPATGEVQREKELKRQAELADLQRKVTRKWPVIVGGVVALWLVGVLVYVMWPTPKVDPVVPGLGKPKLGTTRPVDTGNTPLAVHEKPVAVDSGTREVAVAETPKDPAITEDPDAGELVLEDRNEVLPDYRITEERKKRSIEDNISLMEAYCARDADLRDQFSVPLEKLKKLDREANTLNLISGVEDEAQKLMERFNKQLK